MKVLTCPQLYCGHCRREVLIMIMTKEAFCKNINCKFYQKPFRIESQIREIDLPLKEEERKTA